MNAPRALTWVNPSHSYVLFAFRRTMHRASSMFMMSYMRRRSTASAAAQPSTETSPGQDCFQVRNLESCTRRQHTGDSGGQVKTRAHVSTPPQPLVTAFIPALAAKRRRPDPPPCPGFKNSGAEEGRRQPYLSHNTPSDRSCLPGRRGTCSSCPASASPSLPPSLNPSESLPSADHRGGFRLCSVKPRQARHNCEISNNSNCGRGGSFE